MSLLKTGTEVYVERRLSLNTWAGKDGAQRTGLAVMAVGGAAARPHLPQAAKRRITARSHYTEAPPLDDPLTF